MKYSFLLALTLSLMIGVSNAHTVNHTDSSLAKKVLVLEQKLADQQKQIEQLKAKNTTTATYTIDRRGSKQWIKKTN